MPFQDASFSRLLKNTSALRPGEQPLVAEAGDLLAVYRDDVPLELPQTLGAGFRWGKRGRGSLVGYSPTRLFVIGNGKAIVRDIAYVIAAHVRDDSLVDIVFLPPGGPEWNPDAPCAAATMRLGFKPFVTSPADFVQGVLEQRDLRLPSLMEIEQQNVTRAAAALVASNPEVFG